MLARFSSGWRPVDEGDVPRPVPGTPVGLGVAAQPQEPPLKRQRAANNASVCPIEAAIERVALWIIHATSKKSHIPRGDSRPLCATFESGTKSHPRECVSLEASPTDRICRLCCKRFAHPW